MAYSWKGSISFGLVYIPIALTKTAQEERISFRQLDKDTKQRIRYKKVTEVDEKPIETKEIIKGYEYDKDKYVIFDDDDLEKIKTPKDKSITIDRFVDLQEIDPIYYNTTYYVEPKGAERAYALLAQAMLEENKVGIAKVVLGERENIIALRVREKEMLLSTLFFNSEIKKSKGNDINPKLEPKELELAKILIENMTKPFSPEDYSNEFNIKLMKAIESKIKGEEIIEPQEEQPNPAIDLMQALQESLNASNRQGAPLQ